MHVLLRLPRLWSIGARLLLLTSARVLSCWEIVHVWGARATAVTPTQSWDGMMIMYTTDLFRA